MSMWLVLGLGNPGPAYAVTRHNVGQRVINELSERHSAPLVPVRGVPALTAEIPGALLVRSTTYMNESGRAVSPLAARWNIPADHIIIVHDELDLPDGKIRIRSGGSENGHRGLTSVSNLLATRDYVRVRVGVGRPAAGCSVIDHVMEPSPEDTDPAIVASAADAVDLIISRGVSLAQNEIHRRDRPGRADTAS